MTATTIKVPSELRDRLNSEARVSGGTVAQVIEQLLTVRDRAERFRRMRAERAALSSADRAELQDEYTGWVEAEAAGLPSDDD